MSADWDGLLAVWAEAALVLGYVSLVAAALAADAAGVVRAALVAPLLAFLPGYALLAALFPSGARDADPTVPDAAAAGTRALALSWSERCAFAVALSLLLLAPCAAAGRPPAADRSVLALAALSTLAYGVGVARRLRRPPARRYAPPFRRWARALRGVVASTRAAAGRLIGRGD